MKSISTVYAFTLAATVCAMLSMAETAPVRSKARTTRGFKNANLSTARGFGKRGSLQIDHRGLQLEGIDPTDQGRELFGRILSERPDNDSFPAEWFAEELASNADLARIVTSKLADDLGGNLDLARLVTSHIVDRNQDGELTADELLRPTY